MRDIFDQIHDTGISLRQLAADLSKRQIPGPGKKGWTKDILKTIITQPAYTGTAKWAHRRKTKKEFHQRQEEVLTRENACPAIIPKSLFEDVQTAHLKKLSERRKPQTQRAGTLSGLLVCGRCGYRLEKRVVRDHLHYTCSSANKRQHLGCKQWRVVEVDELPKLMDWLVKEVDFELLKRLQASPPENGNSVPEEQLLEDTAKSLRAKIDKTRRRLLGEADDEEQEEGWKILNEWKAELKETEGRLEFLRAIQGQTPTANFSVWWEKVKADLVTVAHLQWSEPMSHREPVIPHRDWKKKLTKPGKFDLGDGKQVELDADGQWWMASLVQGPTRPAVIADRATLREFLTKIGFKATYWWRHEPEARKVDRRAFEWVIDRTEITVAFDISKTPSEIEKDVAGDSSRSTHVRTRGTG